MIIDIITADKDKKDIFDKNRLEMLLPVSYKGFKFLEVKCPDALKQFLECIDDENVKTTWIELKVAFDFENMDTHFFIITRCIYNNGNSKTWIDDDLTGNFRLDGITAEYIKNKAIKEFLNSIEAMACCVNSFEE